MPALDFFFAKINCNQQAPLFAWKKLAGSLFHIRDAQTINWMKNCIFRKKLAGFYCTFHNSIRFHSYRPGNWILFFFSFFSVRNTKFRPHFVTRSKSLCVYVYVCVYLWSFRAMCEHAIHRNESLLTIPTIHCNHRHPLLGAFRLKHFWSP